MRKVSAACNHDGIAEAYGGHMLPVAFRPAPGESIIARFGFPHVSKVLEGAQMGMAKDISRGGI